MRAFAKAVLTLARYIRRMAVALEEIRDLYQLDLAERGLNVKRPAAPGDELEIMYGAREPEKEDEP